MERHSINGCHILALNRNDALDYFNNRFSHKDCVGNVFYASSDPAGTIQRLRMMDKIVKLEKQVAELKNSKD